MSETADLDLETNQQGKKSEQHYATKMSSYIKHDVISTSSPESETLTNSLLKNTESVPNLVVFHDSTLDGRNFYRLGLAYGFSAKTFKTPVTADVEKNLKSDLCREIDTTDAVLIHCGLNEVRSDDKSTSSCISTLKNTILHIKSRCPHAKVLVSKITPAKDSSLDIEKGRFHAQLSASLEDCDRVVIVSHGQGYWLELSEGASETACGFSLCVADITP